MFSLILDLGDAIRHFRNEKQSGASRISQSLVGQFLESRRQAGRHFVPSNGPTSDCEMRFAPDCFVSKVAGLMVSALNPDQAVRIRALDGVIVLCSWARHFTLIVPLSTRSIVRAI